MLLIEIHEGELLEEIEQSAKEKGITDAAIVTLIGAVDSFTLSTMPADDAMKDIITDYDLPAEMTATGEIVNGKPHIHAVMAVEGDRAISGHLHRAQIGTWFARAYVLAHDETVGGSGTARRSMALCVPLSEGPLRRAGVRLSPPCLLDAGARAAASHPARQVPTDSTGAGADCLKADYRCRITRSLARDGRCPVPGISSREEPCGVPPPG